MWPVLGRAQLGELDRSASPRAIIIAPSARTSSRPPTSMIVATDRPTRCQPPVCRSRPGPPPVGRVEIVRSDSLGSTVSPVGGRTESRVRRGATACRSPPAPRALCSTRLRPAVDVDQILRESGVLLLFVEPPAKFPLYGITRWIDRRTPLIQQTGRRSKDGFIVWTLFHEIGRVLNDPRGTPLRVRK